MNSPTLFQNNYQDVKPLAMKLRPKSLKDFIGQEELLGEGKLLNRIIKSGNISNMISASKSGECSPRTSTPTWLNSLCLPACGLSYLNIDPI